MSCPEGQYFCNDRQKCMPIPKGKKVRKDGELVSEVAPPGWGHTKAEKEKTKPDKPKSKIGGSAAAFKRALDDGRFKGLPGDKTKKEKTASMFKLMWSMKKKGAKPHYKPGTDKKYKKYQDKDEKNESFVLEREDSPYEHASRGSLAGKTRSTGTSEKEHKTSFRRKAHRNSAAMIIRAKRKAERSGKKLSDDAAGDLAHKGWASSVKHHKSSMTPEQQKRRQKLADTPYKKLSKDEQDKDKVSAKAIMSVHDKQKKKKVNEDWKPEIEVIDTKKRKKEAEKKRKEAASSLPPHLRLDAMKKAFAHTNEQTSMKDNNLFGNAYAGSYEKLKKKIGSKKKHDKPAIAENKFVKAMVDAVRKKKGEKKPQKAQDAGARAKRLLQRKVHAKYVSGSEDLVPDDLRDHKNWSDFKKHI